MNDPFDALALNGPSFELVVLNPMKRQRSLALTNSLRSSRQRNSPGLQPLPM